jgi:hypothetical protein
LTQYFIREKKKKFIILSVLFFPREKSLAVELHYFVVNGDRYWEKQQKRAYCGGS